MNRNLINQTILSNTNLTASNSYLKIANIDELITDDIDINNLTTNKASINNITSVNIETKEIETDEIILKNNRLKTSTNNNINIIDSASTLINTNSEQTISGIKTFNNLRLSGDTIVYNSGSNNLLIGNIVDLNSNQTLTNKIINSSTGNFTSLQINSVNVVDLSSTQSLSNKSFSNTLRCDTLLTTPNIGIGCLNPANNEILKRNLILDGNSSVSNYNLNLTGDNSDGRCSGIAFTITGAGSDNGMTWVYPNHTPGGSIIFERTGSWSLGILRFLIKNSGTQTGALTNVMNLYNNKVEILKDLICDDIICVSLTISKPLILTDLTVDNLTINKPLILTQDLTTTNLNIGGNLIFTDNLNSQYIFKSNENLWFDVNVMYFRNSHKLPFGTTSYWRLYFREDGSYSNDHYFYINRLEFGYWNSSNSTTMWKIEKTTANITHIGNYNLTGDINQTGDIKLTGVLIADEINVDDIIIVNPISNLTITNLIIVNSISNLTCDTLNINEANASAFYC